MSFFYENNVNKPTRYTKKPVTTDDLKTKISLRGLDLSNPSFDECNNSLIR